VTTAVNTQLYIGLMSGTSIDGIDVGLFECSPTRIAMMASHQASLPEQTKQAILALSQPGNFEIDVMGQLDISLGKAFADAALALLDAEGIAPSRISAIGSHGQTIRHRPDAEHPFTLQIGDPNTIAEITGITTVADFRKRDMAAGGQGAPLAPAFHEAVFHSPNERRCIVNIGGMANISVLKHGDHHTLGYDTGPGNVLLDAWIQHQQQIPYDDCGQWAASGQLNPQLLNKMLNHPYLKLAYPKSTGREDFHMEWLITLLSETDLKLNSPAVAPEDIQATLCEFTAASIACAIRQHEVDAVYICGGGAHNNHLMASLARLLPYQRLAKTDALGLEADWVEAGLMAWLACQTLQQLPGNLPAVTGAKKSTILGAIHYSG